MKNLQASIVGLKKTRNSKKVQIVFAGYVQKPGSANSSDNILSMLNKADERFSETEAKRRMHWLTAETANIPTVFPDLKKALAEFLKSEKDSVELKEEIPATVNGKPCYIQVTESTTPFDNYQKDYPEKTAKKIIDKNTGEEMYFINDNKLIYSSTKIVNSEPKHRFLSYDLVPHSEIFTNSVMVDDAEGEDLSF